MHPLLHNEAALACREIIEELEQCHARGFLWKSFGNCNKAKDQVNACLRAERTKRQEENRNEARGKQEKWRELAKELDL